MKNTLRAQINEVLRDLAFGSIGIQALGVACEVNLTDLIARSEDRIVKEKVMIAEARQEIIQAFKNDPDFRRGYIDNISCVLMDRIPEPNKEIRDRIADEILKTILW